MKVGLALVGFLLAFVAGLLVLKCWASPGEPPASSTPTATRPEVPDQLKADRPSIEPPLPTAEQTQAEQHRKVALQWEFLGVGFNSSVADIKRAFPFVKDRDEYFKGVGCWEFYAESQDRNLVIRLHGGRPFCFVGSTSRKQTPDYIERTTRVARITAALGPPVKSERTYNGGLGSYEYLWSFPEIDRVIKLSVNVFEDDEITFLYAYDTKRTREAIDRMKARVRADAGPDRQRLATAKAELRRHEVESERLYADGDRLSKALNPGGPDFDQNLKRLSGILGRANDEALLALDCQKRVRDIEVKVQAHSRAESTIGEVERGVRFMFPPNTTADVQKPPVTAPR